MEAETQHMLQVLKTIMRILGYTNRDVERKLGLCNSYLSRLFSGGMELKFDHIVEIAKAMGLKPEEVFQFAYSQDQAPPSEALQRLRKTAGAFSQPAGAAPPPPPPRSAPTDEDLEQMMARTLRRFFGEMSKAASE